MEKLNKNAVLNKSCHSRVSLSGIPTLDTQSGVDPRQKPSGMTLNFNKAPSSVLTGHLPPHGEVAHFNAPSTLRDRAAEGRVRGKFTRGVTLIELLVVVLIIGILAAVALPQYQKAVERSRIISALPLLKAVYNAQKVYYLANGKYATSVEQLDIDFACPEGVTCVINQSTLGRDVGAPKMELRLDASGLWVVLYYAPFKIGNVEVGGKPYCVASSTNTRGVAICKSFGPVFATVNGYTRVFIEP